MKSLVVLISGGGSNLKALLDAVARSEIRAEVKAVIADRDCAGRRHAENAGVPFVLLDRKAAGFADALNAAVPDCDLVVLAGFLSIIPPALVARFPQKMVNLHPSLLPKFGGAGMYGLRVHQAVLAAGERESGCTVHFVDSGIDSGAVIAQARVPVLADDTAEALQARIAPEEHRLLVATVARLLGGDSL